LFEAEKRIDTSQYNVYQKRVLAFLAERLLNVYVRHHNLKVVYEPVFYITSWKEIFESKIGIKLLIRRIIKNLIPYSLFKHYIFKKEKKLDAEKLLT
jgi:hypothetical protein